MSEDPSKIELSEIFKEGLAYLREDLKKYPSFDPKDIYEAKNYYANRSNNLGIGLMRMNLHHWAEPYFLALLDTTIGYEKQHQKHFNKGMFYANLGLCQIVDGKLGVGIANLLTAEKEDEPVNPPEYNILNTELWEPFEKWRLYPFLISLSQNPNINLNFKVDHLFLDKFFHEMDKQDRLFCTATIWELIINGSIKFTSNDFTLGRMYSNLRDLCLLTETRLRKYAISVGVSDINGLLPMLEKLLKGKGVRTSSMGVPVNSLKDFLKFLEDFLAISDPTNRSLSVLYLVRNFTGHHFDVSENIFSPTGKSFFKDYYDIVLSNVLAAMFYLKSEGCF